MKKIIFCSLAFLHMYVVSMHENKIHVKVPVVAVHKKLSNLDAGYTVRSIATDDSCADYTTDSYSQDPLHFKVVDWTGVAIYSYTDVLAPEKMQRNSSDDWDWKFYKPILTYRKKYTTADLRMYGMFNPEEEKKEREKLQRILAGVHRSIHILFEKKTS